jgi:hypothetical protein
MSKGGKSSRRECRNADQSQFQNTVRDVRHNFSRQFKTSGAVRPDGAGGVGASIPRRSSGLSPASAGVREAGVTDGVVSLAFTVGPPSRGLTRNGSWTRAAPRVSSKTAAKFSRARARPE